MHDERYKVVAAHGNNGQVTHNLYDNRERMVASYTATDHNGNISPAFAMGGYSLFKGFGENESTATTPPAMTFDANTPNSSVSIVVQEETGNSVKVNNQGTQASVGDSFVIQALFTSGSSIGISGGSLSLSYDSGARTFSLDGAVSAPLPAGNLPPLLITLVVVENVGLAFGDGKLLVSTSGLTPLSGTNNAITINGTTSHVLIGQRPLVSLAYHDGLGRVIQSQRIDLNSSGNPNNTVASGVLYDGWGNAAVRTLNTTYTSPPNGYRTGLISSFNWSGGGTMAGDVVNYYTSGGGQTMAGGDGSKPYRYTAYNASPVTRPKTVASEPGTPYAVGGALSLDEEYQSDDGKSFLGHVGIDQNTTDFHVNTSKVPFSTFPTQKVEHQSINDLQGRTVARRVGSGSNYLETSTAYFYNESSAIARTQHQQPNSFDSSNTHASAFVTAAQVQDTAGLVTTSAEPDLDGLAYQIRDKAGRVRFARHNANFNHGCFTYFKYDIRGRMTESGVLRQTEVHTLAGYKTMANSTSYPSSNQAHVKKVYQYDLLPGGDDPSRNYKGRLVSVTAHEYPVLESGNGCVQQTSPSKTILNGYQYDVRARTIGVTLWENGASGRNTGYTYNNLGTMTSVTYPTVAKTNALDLSGQPTVYYTQNAIGQLAAVCSAANCSGGTTYASYTYDLNGRMDDGTLNDGGVNQTYTYDFQNRLQEMATYTGSAPTAATTLYFQSLSYETTDNHDGSDYQGGYIVQSDYLGTGLGSNGAHSYRYDYDIFGRLTTATRTIGGDSNTTDRTYNYQYDPNGNLTRKTVTGSSGQTLTDETYTYGASNRLNTITAGGATRSFSHNAAGGIIGDTATDRAVTYTRELHTDRIYQAETQNQTIAYEYDALGRRLREIITTNTPPAVNNNALQGTDAGSIDVADITLPGDFTIESWVKFSAGQTINNRDGFVNNGLSVGSSGQDLNFWAARFRLYHGGNRVIANTPAVANVWTHYAIVRQNGNLTIYINGVQDATINGSWTAPFVVSEIAGTLAGNLHGQLDELRIWSVARSANAVVANYNREVATNSSGLVGYYKFNDSGTTVTDSAGGDHNGTLGAGTSFVSSTAPLVGLPAPTATPTTPPAATSTPIPTATPTTPPAATNTPTSGSMTNLALGRSASQSSTDFGAGASRAVDGNTNGNSSSGSVTHTITQTQPWWKVDLGASYNINNIVLWNRTDCCAHLLSNYTVYVSDSDISGNNPTANGASSYVRGPAPNPSETIPVNRSGRYVMVRLNGTNPLSLAEVQVFGTAGGPAATNTPTATSTSPPAATSTPTATPATGGGGIQARFVRLQANSEVNGNAWTSVAEFNVLDANGNNLNRSGWTITADSVELAAANRPAEHAIDGNNGSFWHTKWQGSPDPPHPHWITIDLGSVRTISGFKYLPRQSGQNGRIASYQFFVSTSSSTNFGAAVASGAFPNTSAEQTVTISGGPAPTNTPIPTATSTSPPAATSTPIPTATPTTPPAATSTPTSGSLSNVALGKSASQSSTGVLWNRTDCCAHLLSNYTVYVSDSDISGNNPTANGASSYVRGPAPNPSETIPVNRSGRYVMVRLNGTNPLSLAEVQVFGTAGGPAATNTPTATSTSPPAATSTPTATPATGGGGIQARFVRLQANSEVNGNAWTSVAEFNVLDANGNNLNRSGWTITADSVELAAANRPAEHAIDGNNGSFWHTKWQGSPDPPHPHWITIDLGSVRTISGSSTYRASLVRMVALPAINSLSVPQAVRTSVPLLLQGHSRIQVQSRL